MGAAGGLFYWADGLNEKFKLSNRLLNDSEIPSLQRRACVPPLEVFAAMPERNRAILKVYVGGGYGQKEIASAFDIHYATVSRIVKTRVLSITHEQHKR
jgi:hypothetical protein